MECRGHVCIKWNGHIDAKQEARASGLTDDDVDLYTSRDATPAKSAAFD
jgi:hypothetical protein